MRASGQNCHLCIDNIVYMIIHCCWYAMMPTGISPSSSSKLKSGNGKNVANIIRDKTKLTIKNGTVSVILNILVQFHCVVGILSNCT